MDQAARERLFWAKVKRTDGCWEWMACKGPTGYGHFGIANGRYQYAHVYSYELAKGPRPEGLTIDHLCRNRGCVNPDHLEAVTQRENTLRGVSPAAQNARKTACNYGHPYDAANTYVYTDKDGKVARQCLTCRRHHNAEWNAKVKASRLPRGPKMICKRGHPLDDENTYVYNWAGKRTMRQCKACKTIRAMRRWEMQRSRKAAA